MLAGTSTVVLSHHLPRRTLYFCRYERDLAEGDRAAALANLAELREIGR
jgi:hypothetical protein